MEKRDFLMRPNLVASTCAALLLFLSASIAVAQDSILLKNGNSISGKVTASTEDSVTLEYPSEAGSATVTLKANALDPHSFYMIRTAAIGNDAVARAKFAVWCAENGLYSRAKMELERALATDPSIRPEVEARLPAVRARVAAEVLERAKKSLEAGDLGAAQRDISDILTLAGDTPAAREAEEMLGPLEKKIGDRDAANRAVAYEKMQKQADAAARKAEEDRLALVAPIEKRIEEAEKHNMKGLRAARSGTALDNFKDAASEGEKALAAIDDLEKKHADDKALPEVLAPIRSRAVSGAVDAHLNAGSLFLTRSSFQDAMKSANSALALDPGNSAALGLRARIEIAANEDRRRR